MRHGSSVSPVNAPGPTFPCQLCLVLSRQETFESLHMGYSVGGWGGEDGHDWTDKYQLIRDHEQRKKHMLYLLLRPINSLQVTQGEFPGTFLHRILNGVHWPRAHGLLINSPLFHLATDCISSLLSPKVDSYDLGYNCQEKNCVHLSNQNMILADLFTGII